MRCLHGETLRETKSGQVHVGWAATTQSYTLPLAPMTANFSVKYREPSESGSVSASDRSIKKSRCRCDRARRSSTGREGCERYRAPRADEAPVLFLPLRPDSVVRSLVVRCDSEGGPESLSVIAALLAGAGCNGGRLALESAAGGFGAALRRRGPGAGAGDGDRSGEGISRSGCKRRRTARMNASDDMDECDRMLGSETGGMMKRLRKSLKVQNLSVFHLKCTRFRKDQSWSAENRVENHWFRRESIGGFGDITATKYQLTL